MGAGVSTCERESENGGGSSLCTNSSHMRRLAWMVHYARFTEKVGKVHRGTDKVH